MVTEAKAQLLSLQEQVLLALLIPPAEVRSLLDRLSGAMANRKPRDAVFSLLALHRLRSVNGYEGETFAPVRARLAAISRAIRLGPDSEEGRWAEIEKVLATDMFVRRGG